MKQPAYFLALVLASRALAGPDVIEDALRATPAGATDLLPLHRLSGAAPEYESLHVTIDVIYPADYTSCQEPEGKSKIFSPVAPIAMPPMLPRSSEDFEE